jgi:endonuclease YncB( thermonuclease family)
MAGRAAVLAALGLIVIGSGVLAVRSILVDDPQAEDGGSGAQVAAPAPAPRPAPPKLARVRPVAPEIVAQPQIAPAELERVEPRGALSRFGRPLPPKPKNNGRIYRPFIDAAGRFSGSGLVVTVAGIEVTLPDRTCTDGQGREWPCGVRARTAFRSFVRGRALACDLPEELTQDEYTVACSLGGRDVGQWLAEQGWADAVPGGPYAQAAAAARDADRGIYGDAPVVEELPAEEPTEMVGALTDRLAEPAE